MFLPAPLTPAFTQGSKSKNTQKHLPHSDIGLEQLALTNLLRRLFKYPPTSNDQIEMVHRNRYITRNSIHEEAPVTTSVKQRKLKCTA